jgi:hypothetical protein
MATRKPVPAHETFTIAKGLTREQAVKVAPKPKNDRRGFSYDSKTGKVIYT